MLKIELDKRSDGKGMFRFVAENGQVVATDGGQGYEHAGDMRQVLEASILRPIREGRVAIVDVSDVSAE